MESNQTQRVKFSFLRLIYVALLLLLLQTPATVTAKSKAELERENAELQATFDLMVRQLAQRDALIRDLRSKLAELKADGQGLPVQLLGCSVETASQKVKAVSFIYERDKTLLEWLSTNLSGCKMTQLKELLVIANDEMLNQSRTEILKEIATR